MSGNVCTVEVCDRPADGGFVCRACIVVLRDVLDEVPWLVDQLEIVITRQTRYGSGRGGGGKTPKGSKTTPLPMDIRASDALRELRAVLVSWSAMLAEENGWATPDDDVVAMAAWLWNRLETVRLHEAGGDAVAEISAQRATAMYAVDRPADRWFAGVCSATSETSDVECDEDLYAIRDTGFIKCKRCGTQHDVKERRARLLEQAEEVLATATEAARAIVVWSDYERGETRLVRRIGAWMERKRIQSHGHITERGRERPLYRIGDILRLVELDAPSESVRSDAA